MDDSPVAHGLFVGLGITMLLNAVFRALISAKDKKALGSDAAVQVEASIMSKSTLEENEYTTYIFHYKFHLPAPRTSSALQKLSLMGGIGSFGAIVTGATTVTHEYYDAHCESLPMDCTVRYVRANPRVSEIVAIGADTDQNRSINMHVFAPIVFGGILFVASIVMAAQQLSGWDTNQMVAFFAIVGVMVVLGLVCAARTAARLPFMPGCTQWCATRSRTPRSRASTRRT